MLGAQASGGFAHTPVTKRSLNNAMQVLLGAALAIFVGRLVSAGPLIQQAPFLNDSDSGIKYNGLELDLSNPTQGIWNLGNKGRSTHQLKLPLTWTNASQDISGDELPTEESATGHLHWSLSNANGSIVVPALFPSQAHLDLIKAGVISEPSIGLNEGALRWVFQDTWTYTASMAPLLDDIKAWDSFLLYFQGIDTVANISLGGQNIGSVNNQFRQWYYDNVTDIVKGLADNDNKNLTLTFEPATVYSERESTKEPHYPDQNEEPNGPASTVYTYRYRNFIRKQQSDFGWDWGPAELPAGPFRPAYLVGFKQSGGASRRAEASSGATGKTDSLFVHGSSIDIYKKDSVNNLPPNQSANWVVNVTLDVFASSDVSDNEVQVQLRDTNHGGKIQLSRSIRKGFNDGLHGTIEIKEGEVERWWPNGFGEQKLYWFDLTLANEAKWSKRSGFRTIIANQERVSDKDIAAGWAPGSHFHIAVNDKRIYTQGSNLIPFDTFYPRASLDVLNWNVDSALLAGQNLIRVWGGGIYQSDALYDICDEKGLLAWSEAIFSVSLYPTYDSFIDTVKVEVKENIRRLNHHPSNTLWAGNNEGEGYIESASQALANGSVYEAQYNELFDNVILQEVRANTRSLSYIPSSTTNGYTSLEPYVGRYLNATPGEVYGDGEYYGYTPDQFWNTSMYSYEKQFRLMNEYGFHSMASVHGLDRVLQKTSDYDFNGTVVRNHNKHSPPGSPANYPWPADDGQYEMSAAVEEWFKKPQASPGTRKNILQWSYSTQVLAAWYISVQTLQYRYRSSLPQRNLGGIYWQLNDIWAGATSWASTEFGGRWKLLHYLMARTQHHIAAYAKWDVDSQQVALVVTSDFLDDAKGSLQATWYDFSGKQLNQTNYDWAIAGVNATVLASGPVSSFLGQSNNSSAWLHLEVNSTHQGVNYYNEEFFAQPGVLHNVSLNDPKLSVEHVSTSGAAVQLQVAADGDSVAPWVQLDHPEGRLGYFTNTDKDGRPSNGFWLRPGERRSIKFVTTFGDATDDGYTIRSLWQNTEG